MKTISQYVAEILHLPTKEERANALNKVPGYLKSDVEKLVKKAWPKRNSPSWAPQNKV